MLEGSRSAEKEQQLEASCGESLRSEFRKTVAPLLRHVVLLLAMKHRRAPLPVSSSLLRGLLRHGFLNDVDELGSFARRYLFLGDERTLLAELNRRSAAAPPSHALLPGHPEIAPG